METLDSKSIYDILSERIFNSERFRSYEHLVQNEILKSLGSDTVKISDLSIEDIQFLLKTASIFACSSTDKYKQLAYSIAILLHSQYKDIYDEVTKITSLLLIRLGNFPAYTLLQRNAIEESSLEDAPINLQLETVAKSLENRVKIAQTELYLTDFQKELYQSLNEGMDFSFAAPTSAGKSFLLILYIIEQLRKTDKINVVYVVPTKALINQVKNDVKANFIKFNIQDVRVISSTISFEFEGMQDETKYKKHVLILTQERLSHLLSKYTLDFNIDILIVDEAQKINDGNRGVVLERTIIQTIAKFPNLKVIFSSPLASNPNFFEKYKASVQSSKTNYSPVHQNVLFINSDKKKPFLSLLKDSLIPISEKSSLQAECPKSKKAKMAFWAANLGKNKSNILYANGAAETEELAKELCQFLPDVSHEKIDNFIEFVKENIHEDYSLVDCLKKGIVFHYSTMPREIKEKIEDLFSDEEVPVTYLCCTSTLLEGMNLPAKNVFIYKPTKGRGNQMNKFDFWNLAGRAGRLLKDFYGNIYCIDVDDWGADSYVPERSIENYNIVSATEESLVHKDKDLHAYLENIREPFPSKERELLEQTCATFVLNYMDNSSNTVAKFIDERKLDQTSESIQKIDLFIQQIVAKNKLPQEILKKNSSIDARLQNELYNLFVSKFYTVFLPKYPKSSDFYDSLKEIYYLINEVFFNNEVNQKWLNRVAFTSMLWIKEDYLSAIIQGQIDYKTKNKEFKSVNRCVSEIVELIDREISYKYAKYLKCYYDILEYHLKTIKVEANIINLSAYLELGAFNPTTLNLLSFGLSRTTAIRMKYIIGNDSLDRKECRKWIDDNYSNYKSRLPVICQEDFERNFE